MQRSHPACSRPSSMAFMTKIQRRVTRRGFGARSAVSSPTLALSASFRALRAGKIWPARSASRTIVMPSWASTCWSRWITRTRAAVDIHHRHRHDAADIKIERWRQNGNSRAYAAAPSSVIIVELDLRPASRASAIDNLDTPLAETALLPLRAARPPVDAGRAAHDGAAEIARPIMSTMAVMLIPDNRMAPDRWLMRREGLQDWSPLSINSRLISLSRA